LPTPSSLSTCEVGNSTVILNTAPHFSQVQNEARAVPALIRQTPRRAPPPTSNFAKVSSSFSPYVSSNSLSSLSNASRSTLVSQPSSHSSGGASAPAGISTSFPGVNAKGTLGFSNANRSSFSGARPVEMDQSFVSARSSSSAFYESMALPSLSGRSEGNGATRPLSASFMHDGSRVKVVNQIHPPRRLSNESNTRHSLRPFQNADLSRSSRDAFKPRSRPQLLPRSFQAPSTVNTKTETPRWIQGVLVKDFGKYHLIWSVL
jgi:hypothetical protein